MLPKERGQGFSVTAARGLQQPMLVGIGGRFLSVHTPILAHVQPIAAHPRIIAEHLLESLGPTLAPINGRKADMATTELRPGNFGITVEDGIVLVDWWAPWCGPCRAFAPIFEKTSAANPDVTFAKVNTEEQPGLATAFGIQAIPTLMAFRDGVLLFQESGVLPGVALQRLVDEVRVLDMTEVRAEIEVDHVGSA
jgi:thioredoxin 1